MKIENVAQDETGRALEVLSVAVSLLMSEHAALANVPPNGESGYAELAAQLRLACSDIATLADAMAVLARRFPREDSAEICR